MRALGLDAERVEPRDLDLTAPGIKVITQRSSKGLEFPIVALAGFDRSGPPAESEGLAESRRAVYVAMTRAMRALLVVVPAGHHSNVLTGFDDARWNRG
jgi:superfamily I DNA/RNA helicase